MKLDIQMFSSTNKTTNYELSQYIGTDKPTYLGDYNSDMSKIDTAIHTNATAISTANGNITTLGNNQGTLSSLTTTDKTSLVGAINEVDSNADTNAINIGTLANLTTENKTTIVNAINEIVAKFNLNDFSTVEFTSTDDASKKVSLTLATNSDKSIFKLYGNANCINPTSTQGYKTWRSGDTGLRPDEEITINPVGIAIAVGSTYYYARNARITIKTTGVIDLVYYADNTSQNLVTLMPCLYFLKNFGDVPSE